MSGTDPLSSGLGYLKVGEVRTKLGRGDRTLSLSCSVKIIKWNQLQHNLEYPELYTKLYPLFTPEALHVKYMAGFLHLTDSFLTSIHLSAYLAAAFIKRLVRLCLTAPSTSIPMAIRFIHNLMIRHPGLAKMIDNSDGQGLS